MAMALAARGDFFATSAVAGEAEAVALTAAVLAVEAAVLPGEFLVALVTDGEAVFAVVGFLAEGGVLTGVLDTWPCRTAVEVLATAFLTGTALEGLDASTGFFAEVLLVEAGFLTAAFLAGTAFLATAFFTGTDFLTTGFFTGAAFLATAFLAGAVDFLAGTDFLAAGLATGFFTAALGAEAAFLATGFLAGALAVGFNLALAPALALCGVDFTAHLLSAGPGKFKGNSPTAVIFYIFTNFFSQ